MNDAALTPHGRVLVALADELEKIARTFRREISERIAGSLSIEILSIQTGRE